MPDSANPSHLYRQLLIENGPVAKGVGWLDEEEQNRRFQVIFDMPLLTIDSLLDVGCGYGAMVDFLKKQRGSFEAGVKYTGLDVLPEMIDIAHARHGYTFRGLGVSGGERAFMEIDVREYAEVVIPQAFDLVVASGTLAYYSMAEKMEILDAMWKLTRKSMVFNIKAHDAYIGDLSMILPRFGSDKWRIRHDYGLGEMTVTVNR